MGMTPDQLRESATEAEAGMIRPFWDEWVRLLRAHAAALEEIETYRPFYIKHALGPKAKPSCLCCGRNDYESVAVQHGELPGIVICDKCKQAERRAERLNAAIRWALGYEDWPERGIGEGPFYWREELRRRADKGE